MVKWAAGATGATYLGRFVLPSGAFPNQQVVMTVKSVAKELNSDKLSSARLCIHGGCTRYACTQAVQRVYLHF